MIHTSSATWPRIWCCPGPAPVLPWVHRVFSNLKTWALGVYHGLRRKHIQAYLNEFTFRYNRRTTRHTAFKSLLGGGLQLKPATYKMLIAPEQTG